MANLEITSEPTNDRILKSCPGDQHLLFLVDQLPHTANKTTTTTTNPEELLHAENKLYNRNTVYHLIINNFSHEVRPQLERCMTEAHVSIVVIRTKSPTKGGGKKVIVVKHRGALQGLHAGLAVHRTGDSEFTHLFVLL